MPAVSQAQFRAMMAAKSGHSTLGIPQKVGADYVAATPTTKGLPERLPAERTNAVVKSSGNPTEENDATPPGNAAPTHAATMLEALTGMSSGHKPPPPKTRRGGGRRGGRRHNATKGGGAALPDHAAIHQQLNLAYQKGDHAGAFKHGLALVNALHRAKNPPQRNVTEDMPGATGGAGTNNQTEPQIL